MQTCRVFVLALVALSTLSAQTVGRVASAVALPEKALVDDLVAANRVLAHEIHVLDAYGHISVRSAMNPNRYYQTRAIAAGNPNAREETVELARSAFGRHGPAQRFTILLSPPR